MTTEELVKKLNSSDYVLAELKIDKSGPYDFILVGGTFSEKLLEVPTDSTNWLDIWCDYDKCQDELNDATREFLGSTISQYLNTPVSKRKTEKKYRLRWIDGEDDSPRKETYLGMDDTFFNGSYWTTYFKSGAPTFTESQLEKLKRDNPRFAPAIDVMKEEVKDDD